MNPNDSRSAHRLKRIDQELRAGDLDQWELAERIVMSRRHIRDYVAYLLAERLAHAVRWIRHGEYGPRIPVLRHGRGRNAKYPERLSHSTRQKRTRERRKLRVAPPDPLHSWIPKR